MVKDKLEAAAEANPELKAVLDKVEKAEDMAKADIDKVKKFNPRKVLGKQIHTVVDKELGEISYGDLTIGDAFEVNKAQSDQEKGLTILYIMLKKAEPTFTWDEMKAMPFDVANRLLDIIGKQGAFLHRPVKK